MKLTKNSILYITSFFFFYITLIIGFFVGEDSSGGATRDYLVHLNIVNSFFENTLNGLRHYPEAGSTHSPVFIILLKYILFYNETLGRFIFLNLCVLTPFIFFLSLKKKIKIDILPIFFLSNFFFLSPYFRSSAIWPGDENLGILFFISSIFFYISFLNSTNDSHRIKLMIYNIFLLAIACYFRPIYSLFSIFFFYEFILKNFKINYFLIYIFLSILLAFPAFYYVFILKINFFSQTVGIFNLLNSFPLTYSVLIYFLIPFIFFSNNNYKIFKFSKLNLLFTIIFSFIVFKFFDYQLSTGGGIIFMSQNFFFKGNFVFTIIFAIAFYLTNQILEINKTKNFLLLIILLFNELDFYFYMETFDPLFLICFFLLFDLKIFSSFFDKDVNKKIIYLFIYLFLFFTIKINYLYLI